MGLPKDIQDALAKGALRRQHPIKYQIFQLYGNGHPRQHVLVPSETEPFSSQDDAHHLVAKLIDQKRLKNVQFVILPIISA